ncbi:hypothetical protein ES705_24778 [subsurface metagenome]
MSEMLDMMIRMKEMLKNYKIYLKKINESIKTVLSDSKVYLFGSIIEGNIVG